MGAVTRRYDDLMAAEPAQALPIHRLDIETYEKIVASGALEGEHIELLDGAIVDMSPHSTSHAEAIRLLTRHFSTARAWLQVQLPLAIPPNNEPEPDLALTADRPPHGEHPRTALLAIEVAVTSQEVDRGLKAALYATAAIPSYWLIDIPSRVVEVRTEPGLDGYRRLQSYREGEVVPCDLEGVASLDVTALLAGIRS